MEHRLETRSRTAGDLWVMRSATVEDAGCRTHLVQFGFGIMRQKPGRAWNSIPQSVICHVGERDGVWQAGLPLLCRHDTAVDPIKNHPHADAVSLANGLTLNVPAGSDGPGMRCL